MQNLTYTLTKLYKHLLYKIIYVYIFKSVIFYNTPLKIGFLKPFNDIYTP